MAVAIKSLDSFVGTVSNVTYRNFVLDAVDQAIMMNVYGQSVGDAPQVSSFNGITIQNITGTAKSPGKLLCDASIECKVITLVASLPQLPKSPGLSCRMLSPGNHDARRRPHDHGAEQVLRLLARVRHGGGLQPGAVLGGGCARGGRRGSARHRHRALTESLSCKSMRALVAPPSPFIAGDK
jgi:hypothetical protein